VVPDRVILIAELEPQGDRDPGDVAPAEDGVTARQRDQGYMPMTELTTTKGALDDAAKQRLAGELSRIALELEAAPMARFGDVEHMQALSWCFVNEQEVFVSAQGRSTPSRSTA
jgi:hypothetical protein